MTNKNYNLMQKEIFEKVKTFNEKPKLLMHSCCAPCSSYCLEKVTDFFKTDVFYYNPNITDTDEYFKRLTEQILFVEKVYKGSVKVIEGDYVKADFLNAVKGLENEKEGSSRCKLCYKLRMEETAKTAKELGYDYFTTTLSVSPYKISSWLNEIGEELEKQYGVKYLYADFKKENGYKRSIELSNEYGLYRQNYCGCEFSKR